MSLQKAVQGGRYTGQQITWSLDDGTPQDLTGSTLTGTITNQLTGATRAITGTLELVTPASGIFSWSYSAADVAEAGDFWVQFTADYGSSLDDVSYRQYWRVEAVYVAS